MPLSSILNFFATVSMVVNPDCDYYQDLVMGQQYYIYNKEYPGYYTSSTSCRWLAKSPVNTQIVISCEDISLPSSNNCQGDRLSISLSGDDQFKDSRNYCGRGSVSLVSDSNLLVVGLFTTSATTGGRFLCSLTAIQTEPVTTTPNTPYSCDCGWKLGTRIVGGKETAINEYPSMAALIDIRLRDLYCGANIISERYALTAAHCLTNRQPNEIGILVGDHDITTGTDTDAAALYALNDFIIHPRYNQTTQLDDIAIVKTELQMQFSQRVGPVCLPFRYTNYDFYTQSVTALGWGTTSFSGPKSDTLQKVDLNVVSNGECAQDISNPITNNQVCTYAPDRDACQSDSGGPVLWHDNTSRRLQLIGIISYGRACATTVPSVNTRVTSYLSWIITMTDNAVYCIK